MTKKSKSVRRKTHIFFADAAARIAEAEGITVTEARLLLVNAIDCGLLPARLIKKGRKSR